jgi:hypothetical protein
MKLESKKILGATPALILFMKIDVLGLFRLDLIRLSM